MLGAAVLPMRAPNASRARMVLERAAQSLQLHRMIQQEREALVVHALGGLLDDLLSGRITDDAEAQARASALGLTPSIRYVPLSDYPRVQDTDALGQAREPTAASPPRPPGTVGRQAGTRPRRFAAREPSPRSCRAPPGGAPTPHSTPCAPVCVSG